MTRRISTNVSYNLFLNNMTKTVLLSQLIYWDKRKCLTRWNSVWFAKTADDLAKEMCHPSAKSVGDWLREFKEMGIIKTRRGFFGGTHQLWIQVDHERLNAILAEHGVFPEDTNSPAEDHSPENDLPESELTSEDDLPESELIASSNLPESELTPPVNYPTGNSISDITNHKKSDQIDDDLISQYLSQIEISEITQRVLKYVNSKKLTGAPIRNSQRYLQVSLENEAKKVKAQRESSGFDTSITWGDLVNQKKMEDLPPLPAKKAEPENDAIWDATLAKIQEQWDEANFSVWLADSRFISKTEDKYIVAVPNAFVADTLQYRRYDDVKVALSELAQSDFEIEFIVRR